MLGNWDREVFLQFRRPHRGSDVISQNPHWVAHKILDRGSVWDRTPPHTHNFKKFLLKKQYMQYSLQFSTF